MTKKVLAVTLNPSIDKTVEIEELVPYGLNRAVRVELDPGGKGINVARVLRAFGVDVTVTGFAAGDAGKMLRGLLWQEKIGCDLMEIRGETRTNIKIFDRSVKKVTEINERGCEVTPAELSAFEKKIRALCVQAQILVLSGSLPPRVPADTYARFIQTAKAFGAKTILDTDGEALREGIKSLPYAVKPNILELERLFARKLRSPREVLGAGHELTRRGIALVIVSMGPDGAIVLNEKEAYKVDSWDIDVKSATGAGDSMVGALAEALLREAPLADIARATTAAGTITASKPGTQLCTKSEVAAALKLVAIHPLQL
jgi:1-phosphofructokinase